MDKSSAQTRPLLLFDFDNTITLSDVLDDVIARYSETDDWLELEADWREGRMTTLECLRRQVEGLRVSRDDLVRFVRDAPIDPQFERIVDWVSINEVGLTIVSDSFAMLIQEILHRNGLDNVTVYANDLTFLDDRPTALFPFQDPACRRCAHCKAQHLRRAGDRQTIYVGDGLSDLCPAMIADAVFAKDSLAEELTRRGVPFIPFQTLADVLDFLRSRYGTCLVT